MTLIERLEGLDGPCRECDALIQEALMGERWQLGGTPAYTASIDAAMTLLPLFDTEDGPRHADFILEHTNGGLTICASVGHNDPDKVSWGGTPAIALCIAALKAVQS